MEKKLNQFTDEELLIEAKKLKTGTTIDATLIGVLAGILIYGIIADNFNYFFGLLLIYAIYKLVNKNKYKKAAIEKLLKERNLK